MLTIKEKCRERFIRAGFRNMNIPNANWEMWTKGQIIGCLENNEWTVDNSDIANYNGEYTENGLITLENILKELCDVDA